MASLPNETWLVDFSWGNPNETAMALYHKIYSEMAGHGYYLELVTLWLFQKFLLKMAHL